eukprot:551666-Pyramimonas_sp.AAC.2
MVAWSPTPPPCSSPSCRQPPRSSLCRVEDSSRSSVPRSAAPPVAGLKGEGHMQQFEGIVTTPDKPIRVATNSGGLGGMQGRRPSICRTGVSPKYSPPDRCVSSPKQQH